MNISINIDTESIGRTWMPEFDNPLFQEAVASFINAVKSMDFEEEEYCKKIDKLLYDLVYELQPIIDVIEYTHIIGENLAWYMREAGISKENRIKILEILRKLGMRESDARYDLEQRKKISDLTDIEYIELEEQHCKNQLHFLEAMVDRGTPPSNIDIEKEILEEDLAKIESIKYKMMRMKNATYINKECERIFKNYLEINPELAQQKFFVHEETLRKVKLKSFEAMLDRETPPSNESGKK